MENTDFSYHNPYKYNAKEFDMATGLYYYGARYYDPKRSFWLSVDPLAEITMSSYAYVWNDPVNFADPTGMMGERQGKPYDWGRKGNKWEWKKEITKDNYKRLGYDGYSDGKINNTYTSDTGSFVALRENGNWSKDLQPQPLMTSPPNQAWSDWYKSAGAEAPTISSPSPARGKSKFDYVMVDANPLMREIAKRVCVPCGNVADVIELAVETQSPTTTSGYNNASINSRHFLDSNSIANGKTMASTVAPKELLLKDLAAFNLGWYKQSGNDVIINGRTYGVKNQGATIFPRSGGAPEFIDLTQGQIKAIQLMKKVPAGNLNKAIQGAKISPKDANFAREFIKKY